jgi:hypothetical protein
MGLRPQIPGQISILLTQEAIPVAPGLAFPQQFPLQINDLPNVMVGMAGAR